MRSILATVLDGMRRTWSITIVTFREALHSKILLSCAVFAVLVVLIRLGVFATAGSDLWVKVEQFTHIALALILITGAVVTVVVVSPSLSQDIRTKVIHTVIPKPVHRGEILLGKMLGFAGAMGLVLVIVGAITLVILRVSVRGKREEGTRRLLTAEVRVPPTSIHFAGGYLSYMKRSARRWLNPDVPETEEDRLERERLQREKFEPGEATVTFEDLRAADAGGEPLRLEITLGVYRFGGAAGIDPELSIRIANRDTRRSLVVGRADYADAEREPFRIREDTPRIIEIPAAFIGERATLDVLLRNLTPKHRVGIQRTDAMLLLADRSYEMNFLKGLLILFLEVLVVVAIGVMSSTFLSGPVAILFTAVAWVSGHLLGWVSSLLAGWADTGRGPLLEITGEFGRSPFAPVGPLDWVIDFMNSLLSGVLTVATHLFPRLSHFHAAWLVAGNVDITGAMVWRAVQFSVLYSAVCFVIAYACFRVREVAR